MKKVLSSCIGGDGIRVIEHTLGNDEGMAT
jgi:hypothetical protein